MTKRLLIAGLWTGLALFGGQAVSAQTALKTAPIAVNEARARAILGDSSIRFELPLSSPAVTGERATAWMLSPVGASSGESFVDLHDGSRMADSNRLSKGNKQD
jgi:hypothetical protein